MSLVRPMLQTPRGRALALSGPLAFPAVQPLAPLTISAKLLQAQLRAAPASTADSLNRFCNKVADRQWEAGPSYPGLRDELEPYRDDPGPEDRRDEIGKVMVEFGVFSRAAEHPVDFGGLDGPEFIRFLLDLHRRLGAGDSALRSHPVGIRPDAAGNRLKFPDSRQCPALLSALHGFLDRHVADQPALCATVAFAAIIHAHPFNDGNGRTARTLSAQHFRYRERNRRRHGQAGLGAELSGKFAVGAQDPSGRQGPRGYDPHHS